MTGLIDLPGGRQRKGRRSQRHLRDLTIITGHSATVLPDRAISGDNWFGNFTPDESVAVDQLARTRPADDLVLDQGVPGARNVQFRPTSTAPSRLK